VGSSNMDLISYVPHLPLPGETIEGSSFKSGFGGKGANQAVMASLLGGDVAFIGKVGDDLYGQQMKDNFKNHSINISHLSQASNSTSGLAPIFVSSSGENCIVIIPGANNLITIEEIRNAQNLIQKAQVVLFQLEIPLEVSMEALKIAKEGQALTIFNTAPAKKVLPDELYSLVDILCANQTELQTITGETVTSVNEAIQASKKLIQKGVKRVLITLGSEGSMLIEGESQIVIPAAKPPNPVIDTAGAGDCYLGSFAYFLAKTGDYKSAMEKASHISAISVTRHGIQTSYPKRSELPNNFF